MTAPLRELECRVAGRRVQLRRTLPARRGPEPTLIILPGAGHNHLVFDSLLALLGGSDGLDVLVPALPGRAGSEGPALERVQDLAGWLRELLVALAVERVVVAGFSYGGAIALEYAIRDGTEATGAPSLHGLVLLSTGARLRVRPSLLEELRAAVRTDTPLELARQAWLDPGDRALFDQIAGAGGDAPAGAALADWSAADRFDRLQDLASIRARTWVVVGSEDRLTPPRYARHLAEGIAGACLVELAGAGHLFPFTSEGRARVRDTLALAASSAVVAP